MIKLAYYSHQDLPELPTRNLIEKLYSSLHSIPDISFNSYQQNYFKTWVTLFHGDECLGLTALFHNTDCKDIDEGTLFSGFFESANSLPAMKMLTSGVMEYARKNEFSKVIGPINATTWDSYRFSENPTTHPFFPDVIHPPYYHTLWSQCDWNPIESYISTKALISDIVAGIEIDKPFHNPDVQIQPIDTNHFEEEIRSIFELSLHSFKQNRFYSAISFNDFYSNYKQIEPLINPDYTLLAKCNGETVGFIFCIPDRFDAAKETIVIKTLAIKLIPKFKGLGSYLIRLVYLKAQKEFNYAIHALMHASNTSTFIMAKEHTTIQNYHLYEQII